MLKNLQACFFETKEILDKILLYEARAEFCQIFRSFFGAMEFQEKMLLGFTDLYQVLLN